MATLVYDGDCSFCTWTATRGRKLLPADVTLVPWQRADLAALGLNEVAVTRAVQWVATPGSRPRAGHRAISAWVSGPAAEPSSRFVLPPNW